ncbi:MAG: Type secretion system secretin RcpA/CpaC, associated with Flp pilus assembly [Myxococcaceae bacterium]|nr:Type secretion system secretin RcpA/CpaC, associated with Flp pilus assembly [Myxococcaceae bacterium]MEA2751027.1 pilus assembly protein CpaC [Myxococcales bacterium]
MRAQLLVALAAAAAALLATSGAQAQRRHAVPGSAAPAAATPSSSAPEARPTKATTIDVSLVVGENKTIPASDVASYSVGAPGVVDVKVTPDQNQFVVIGLRPGSTTVLMLKRNGAEVTYAINVYQRAPETVEKELEALLVGYTGLRIRAVGPRFFIEGGVSTEADAKRINLIASLYPGQVESLVVVGSVGEEHTINVRIDFYFVQYDKTSSYGVGLAFPGRIGGGSLNATYDLVGKTGTATLTAAQALPALDLAQTRGWAKVLKHSVVVTTSGSEATFENGGEQNFAVATGITSSIQAIKFGTNVTVLPRYDMKSKELEVKVNAQVADLTAPAASALPGRTTSAINTFVHLKLGQSLVLSGIRTSRQVHGVTGIPGLSQIPVVGLLFGSHTNSEDEVEGAVFIIPSVVDTAPRRSHDIVEAAMKQYEDYSGNIDHLANFKSAPPSYQ